MRRLEAASRQSYMLNFVGASLGLGATRRRAPVGSSTLNGTAKPPIIPVDFSRRCETGGKAGTTGAAGYSQAPRLGRRALVTR